MNETQLRVWGHATELEARFWSKVDIVDDDDSCWEWRRAKNPDGYGHFQWNAPGEKRRAHNAQRVAFYLTNGCFPGIGCHTCDNPPCCRPSHVYDGTHETNSADRVSRGRAKGKPEQRGEANTSAVLTDAIVVEARVRALGGERHDSIATALGVRRPTLTLAITGRTWGHLNEIQAPVPTHKGGTRLTEDDVRAIRADVAAGVPQKTLAQRHGLTAAAVSHIVRRKSWAHVTP